jgi:hypothetical protein
MNHEPKPSTTFQELVRLAAVTDSYDDLCVNCHRMSKFAHSGTVAGVKWYTCARCGSVRRTPGSRQ